MPKKKELEIIKKQQKMLKFKIILRNLNLINKKFKSLETKILLSIIKNSIKLNHQTLLKSKNILKIIINLKILLDNILLIKRNHQVILEERNIKKEKVI